MTTNHPVQFQPGMTAPCLRSRASASAVLASGGTARQVNAFVIIQMPKCAYPPFVVIPMAIRPTCRIELRRCRMYCNRLRHCRLNGQRETLGKWSDSRFWFARCYRDRHASINGLSFSQIRICKLIVSKRVFIRLWKLIRRDWMQMPNWAECRVYRCQ